MTPDYGLCDMAVTVYHRAPDGKVTRTVHPRAFLDFKKVRSVDKTGSKDAMGFLLVVPGNPDIEAGDKVMLGEGPEVEGDAQWRELIPSKVDGLCVVSYADRKYLHGQVIHVEAGGQR